MYRLQANVNVSWSYVHLRLDVGFRPIPLLGPVLLGP